MCIFLAAAAPAAAATTTAAVGSTAATGIAAAAASTAAASAASALSAFQIGSLALTALGGGFSIFNQFQQAQGQKAEAKAQAKMASNNAKSAEAAAQDALDRGAEEELQNRRKYSQLAGTQRADFASRGIDMGEGSALAQLDDTYMFENVDSNIIKQNSQRDAFAFRNQASGYAGSAAMYRSAASGFSPLMAGAGTLLTTAGAVADKWYRYKELDGAGY
jgi:hypothetical protein